jgi:hypothetical protein
MSIKPMSPAPVTPEEVPVDLPTPIAVIKRQQDIPNGTKVPITVNGKTVEGIKVGYLPDVDKCLVKYGPHTHRRKIHGFGDAAPRVKDASLDPIQNGAALTADGQMYQCLTPPPPPEIEVWQSRFDINTRFQFIEDFADDIIDGTAKSLIVLGSGGLGKTYTVLARLKKAGLKSDDDVEEGKPYGYTVIKGFSTPKSMYRLMYNNREKIIVFDDCDSVLDNDVAVNLLKAALDSYESRWVHWLSERSDDDDLPQRFEFKGKIIFISNRSMATVDQAVLNRADFVDVTMTADEKIQRIKALAPHMATDLSDKERQDVLDVLDQFKEEITDLSLRTFLKVAKLRRKGDERWADRAEYLITSGTLS